jgi:two-component system response regulator FlrC
MLKRIVVADDDPTMRSALCEALGDCGYSVTPCADGHEAERHLRQSGADIVVSDVRMPGPGGLDLLRRFHETVPFVLISGFATVPEAVEAMKGGAYDFVVKPFSHRELIQIVEAALSRNPAEEARAGDDGEFITENPRMRALLEFARQVAKSHASILIQGESGTGKELLARYIHAHSRRRAGPFVAVNCAALPEGLLESELFGHERGAFTGAVVSKPGKFELAHGGTLLLDEISELPMPLQAKLLRVLQEREVDRVGGKKPQPIDIRVIATTNRELRAMARGGNFREDLFYRLNVVPLRLFPLRERAYDIEPLARGFFQTRGYAGASLSAQAAERLRGHSWRGNVRELFNVLERAAIMAQGGAVEAEHLLLEDELEPWNQPAFFGRDDALEKAHEAAGAPMPAAPADGCANLSVRAMEEQLIFQALSRVNNNRTLAAKILGISVRTLRNKLRTYRERQCRVEA